MTSNGSPGRGLLRRSAPRNDGGGARAMTGAGTMAMMGGDTMAPLVAIRPYRSAATWSCSCSSPPSSASPSPPCSASAWTRATWSPPAAPEPRLLRPSPRGVVAGLGRLPPRRHRGAYRRAPPLHRPVRPVHLAHVPPRHRHSRPTRRPLGRGAAEPVARIRRHHRHLGAAGRPARLRVAGAALCLVHALPAQADTQRPAALRWWAAPVPALASPCSRSTPPS